MRISLFFMNVCQLRNKFMLMWNKNIFIPNVRICQTTWQQHISLQHIFSQRKSTTTCNMRSRDDLCTDLWTPLYTRYDALSNSYAIRLLKGLFGLVGKWPMSFYIASTSVRFLRPFRPYLGCYQKTCLVIFITLGNYLNYCEASVMIFLSLEKILSLKI